MRRPAQRIVAATILGLAALGASGSAALAGGIPPAPEPEREPGISVTGLGFARSKDSAAAELADPDAIARAVRNARGRADVIARALGIGLGEIEAVELRTLSQFGERRTRGIAGAAATVRLSIVGGANESGGREVRAYGAARAPVRPRDADRSRAIKRAMLAARREVAPEAAADARRNAAAAAGSGGIAIGAILSVSESPAPYYGYGSFYDAALGSFGPGRFCGYFRRPVIRPDRRTGLPHVVRRVWRRSCTFQTHYSLNLEVAYLAQ